MVTLQNVQQQPLMTTFLLESVTQSTTITTATSGGNPHIHYLAPNIGDFVHIDQQFNLIGCHHTPQFSEGLFVGVREKSGGAFPGYIAQKKQSITDPDPKPGENIDSKKEWLIKPGLPHDMFNPQAVSVLTSLKNRQAKMGAIQECLAAILYQYLSGGHYRVPKTKLAYLPWLNKFTDTSDEKGKILKKVIAGINQNREQDDQLTRGIHLLSKMVVGYQDLNQAKVYHQGQTVDFMTYVKTARTVPEYILVEIGGQTESLKIIGLIEILAVGKLMHDVDVLGAGNNIGFVIEQTDKGKVARAVKVDPGLAFYTFFGEGENCLSDDVVNMFIKSLKFSVAKNISIDDYSNHLSTALQPILKDIGKAYEKFYLKDLKDIQTDTWCNMICWSTLTNAQQRQFLLALDGAISQLEDYATIKYLLWRDGLLEKTFGSSVKPVDIDKLLGSLEENCQNLVNIYHIAFEEQNIQRKSKTRINLGRLTNTGPNTVQMGVDILIPLRLGLRRHAENNCYITRLFAPTTAHDNRLHIRESYVNLAIISRPVAKEDEKEKKNTAGELDDEIHGDRTDKVHGKDGKDKSHGEDGKDDLSVAFQDERQQYYESLQKTKTAVELEKLFDDPKHRRQLIIGTAGVGKSTLCQQLFYRCAQENGLWSDKFKAVFWIPLRKLKQQPLPSNLNELLAMVVREYGLSGHIQDNIKVEDLEGFITKNSSQILWILDGFDEVIVEANQERSLIQKFFEKLYHNKENSPAILITSRPQTQYLINQTPLLFDRVLENIGFRDENVEKYLSQFLSTTADESARQDEVNQCLRQLKQNPTLWNCVHVPILLDIVCSIWESIPKEDLNKINALPMLYEKMVGNLWLHYLNKTQPGTKFSLTDVANKTAYIGRDIATLAAIGFNHQEIILSHHTLHETYQRTTLNNLTFNEWCDLLVSTGFLSLVSGNNPQDRLVCFIHLSFQEYFAAQYYAKVFTQEDKSVKQLLTHTKYSLSHRLMWQFAFAKAYQHYQATQDETLLLNFWQIVLSSIDIQGSGYFGLIMDLLESCGVDRTIEIHEKVFQQVYAILFNHRYNPLLLTRPNVLKACLLNVPRLSQEQLEILTRLFVNCSLRIELAGNTPIINGLLLRFSQTYWFNRERIINLTCKLLSRIAMASDQIVIPALFQLLKDNDRRVSNSAGEALGEIAQGNQEVIVALFFMLTEEKHYIRESSCEVLGKIAARGHQGVIQTQLLMLKDEDWGVRRSARKALNQVAAKGDHEVIEALLSLFKDGSWMEKETACEVLGKIAAKGDQEVIQALLSILKDEKFYAREEACNALGKIATTGDQEVIQVLLSILKDEKSDVRKEACNALGKIAAKGDQEVIQALLLSLKDKEYLVKREASNALVKIVAKGDQKVIQALLSMLKDEEWEVRAVAYQALSVIAAKGDQEVIQALLSMLKDEEWEVRNVAYQALSVIAAKGDQEVIQALLPMLFNESWLLGKTARKAFGKIATRGDQKVIQVLLFILKKGNWEEIKSACKALGQITDRGNQEAIQALLSILKDEYVDKYACEALGNITGTGDQEVIQALLSILKDEKSDIREEACNTLGKIAAKGDQEVTQALLLSLEDEYIGKYACEALGKIAASGDQEVIQALLLKLKDKYPDIRQICTILGKIAATTGDQQVIQALLPFLKDERCEVSASARDALKNLMPRTMKEAIQRSTKPYLLFLLSEALLHAVFYEDRIELYLIDPKDTVVYEKTHPNYSRLVGLFGEFASQNNIEVVNAFLRYGVNPALANNGHCIIS